MYASYDTKHFTLHEFVPLCQNTGLKETKGICLQDSLDSILNLSSSSFTSRCCNFRSVFSSFSQIELNLINISPKKRHLCYDSFPPLRTRSDAHRTESVRFCTKFHQINHSFPLNQYGVFVFASFNIK